MSEQRLVFNVMEEPFGACGTGEKNDRPAIQAAIDAAYVAGGGTVFLPGGKTYRSGNLILKSHVTLEFGENAFLVQSTDPQDYVRPAGDGYEACAPCFGHNISGHVKWNHAWYANLPMLYAGEGTTDVKICGKGYMKMMEGRCEDVMHICPIGFYRVSHFEISDVTIIKFRTYAFMIFTCDHGLIKNVSTDAFLCGNNDGINMMNSRDIRITGCNMYTGDDSLYIFSSYNDPRGGTWWSSAEPQASENIEVDHCYLRSNHCKAFAMILWGLGCPDLEKVEVRNLYVHDNHFVTMGVWLYNPYVDKTDYPPVTDVRFENNVIDAIEDNFFETSIGNMNYFHSMTDVHNGKFEDGRCFWSMQKNTNDSSVGVVRGTHDAENSGYGFIDHLDEGNARLFQGIYLTGGRPYELSLNVKSSARNSRLTVRNLDTQEAVATRILSQDFPEWTNVQMDFEVVTDGNYQIGIERGDARNGCVRISKVELYGHRLSAFGYKKATKYDGKVIYLINDNPDI